MFCEGLVRKENELALKGGILFIKSRFNFDTEQTEGVVDMSSKDYHNAVEILKESVFFLRPVSPKVNPPKKGSVHLSAGLTEELRRTPSILNCKMGRNLRLPPIIKWPVGPSSGNAHYPQIFF